MKKELGVYKQIAVSFLELVTTGKVREAYERYIGKEFRHHNAYFPGDRESLMLAMEEDAEANPNKVFEVKFAMEENKFVTVYSHVKQNPDDLGVALVHIFRFQDGQVVELWDIGQAVPKNSPNEYGMF